MFNSSPELLLPVAYSQKGSYFVDLWMFPVLFSGIALRLTLQQLNKSITIQFHCYSSIYFYFFTVRCWNEFGTLVLGVIKLHTYNVLAATLRVLRFKQRNYTVSIFGQCILSE